MRTSASVACRFSRSAGTYARGAALHESVGDALLADLPWPEPVAVRTILEAGCGTGVLSVRLRRAYPAAQITAIDVAEDMVRSARDRMMGDAGFRAVQADARTFYGGPFDLAASSSALHWMTPLGDTALRLAALVKPGGALRVALMVEGTLGELHDTRRRLFPDVLPVDRLPRPSEALDALSGAGWRIERAFERDFRPSYASAADFLRLIHAQGLTGGGVSHGRRLLTRGELARLTDAYGATYRGTDSRVWATYRVFFVAAARP